MINDAVLLKERELYGYIFKSRKRSFSEAVHSQIYVDKTELISYTNNVLATNQKNICVSRPRRFGKSITANMLAAYYSKGCQSDTLFKDRKISCSKDYKNI